MFEIGLLYGMIWKRIRSDLTARCLKVIEVLGVVMVWVMGLHMDVDVTKNDDQRSGCKVINQIKRPMNEGNIVVHYKKGVTWSD